MIEKITEKDTGNNSIIVNRLNQLIDLVNLKPKKEEEPKKEEPKK